MTPMTIGKRKRGIHSDADGNKRQKHGVETMVRSDVITSNSRHIEQPEQEIFYGFNPDTYEEITSSNWEPPPSSKGPLIPYQSDTLPVLTAELGMRDTRYTSILCVDINKQELKTLRFGSGCTVEWENEAEVEAVRAWRRKVFLDAGMLSNEIRPSRSIARDVNIIERDLQMGSAITGGVASGKFHQQESEVIQASSKHKTTTHVVQPEVLLCEAFETSQVAIETRPRVVPSEDIEIVKTTAKYIAANEDARVTQPGTHIYNHNVATHSSFVTGPVAPETDLNSIESRETALASLELLKGLVPGLIQNNHDKSKARDWVAQDKPLYTRVLKLRLKATQKPLHALTVAEYLVQKRNMSRPNAEELIKDAQAALLLPPLTDDTSVSDYRLGSTSTSSEREGQCSNFATGATSTDSETSTVNFERGEGSVPNETVRATSVPITMMLTSKDEWSHSRSKLDLPLSRYIDANICVNFPIRRRTVVEDYSEGENTEDEVPDEVLHMYQLEKRKKRRRQREEISESPTWDGTNENYRMLRDAQKRERCGRHG